MLSEADNPDLFKASVVSVGLLGVVTEVTLRIGPAFNLHETLEVRMHVVMSYCLCVCVWGGCMCVMCVWCVLCVLCGVCVHVCGVCGVCGQALIQTAYPLSEHNLLLPFPFPLPLHPP